MLVLCAGPGASAAGNAGDPDEAITVSPTIRTLEVDADSTATFDVLVQNQTLRDVQMNVRTSDLATRSGGSDSPRFADPGSSARGAGDWLATSPTQWAADAGTERKVRVTVRVPSAAGAGGHFAALIIAATPIGDTGQIKVTPETSVYVFITVRGDFEQSLTVDIRPTDGLRWRGGITSWDIELRNTGDVQENYSGEVVIDGLLASSERALMQPGILLPDERRTERIRVDARDAPDVLQAHARIVRDGAPDVQRDAARVVVFPWWVLVVLALAVGIIAWRVRTDSRSRLSREVPIDPA